MTDMYIHVVDEASNTVVKPEAVVRTIDANFDYLARYYEQVGIHQVVPAEVKTEEVVFDSNLIAFIALVIALFIGFVTFAVVLCCLRYWYLSPTRRNGGGGGLMMKLHESSPRPLKTPLGGPGSVVEDGLLGGTDNPLWIDQKFKAYEEQELTMTVFSDQDNSVISGNGGSGNSRYSI
jgi:hypothetical protein